MNRIWEIIANPSRSRDEARELLCTRLYDVEILGDLGINGLGEGELGDQASQFAFMVLRASLDCVEQLWDEEASFHYVAPFTPRTNRLVLDATRNVPLVIAYRFATEIEDLCDFDTKFAEHPLIIEIRDWLEEFEWNAKPAKIGHSTIEHFLRCSDLLETG